MFLLAPAPIIMGIVNLTPDSFFEGSRTASFSHAQAEIEKLHRGGADIIDIGAESTRPGAAPVSVDAELDRLLPLLSWLKDQHIPFSIDTRKAAVMRAVLPFNPRMINDVNALQGEGAIEVVAQHTTEVCLMHAQGEPGTMQDNPTYADVVAEVMDFFRERLSACEQAGIAKERVVIDPGFGFGKTLQHNIKMLQSLQTFKTLGCRLLVGMSRKSMIGAMLNKPVEDRLYGSLTAHMVALLQGADIIRTHDVVATKDMLTVLQALT
jgi:dihydropteroate synthase